MTLFCPLCEEEIGCIASLVSHLDIEHKGWRDSIDFPCPYCESYESDNGISGISHHSIHQHPEESAKENEILYILAKDSIDK